MSEDGKPIFGRSIPYAESGNGYLTDPVLNLMSDDIAEVVKTKEVKDRPTRWMDDHEACQALLVKNLTYIFDNLNKWSVMHHVRACALARTRCRACCTDVCAVRVHAQVRDDHYEALLYMDEKPGRWVRGKWVPPQKIGQRPRRTAARAARAAARPPRALE